MKSIKETSGRADPASILVTAVVVVITVYVVYAIISAFVQNDPSFGSYGWSILGALVVCVVAFLSINTIPNNIRY